MSTPHLNNNGSGYPSRKVLTWYPVATSCGFWIISILSVLSMPVIELMLPRLNPTRFLAEGIYKVVYILPVSICWLISIRCGDAIGLRARFWSGLAQSLGLVYLTYREYDAHVLRTVCGIPSSNAAGVILLWIVLVVGYPALFTAITWLFRHRTPAGAHNG